jgi:hypothetical protein
MHNSLSAFPINACCILLGICSNSTSKLGESNSFQDDSISAGEKLAHWVMQQLHEISVSGVYRHVHLHSIESVRVFSGNYHQTVTQMAIKLYSEYFESNRSVESYKILIMDDGHVTGKIQRAWAIDQFPRLRQEVIDEYNNAQLHGYMRRKEKGRN